MKYLTELHKTLRPHKNKQDCARLYSISEDQTRLNEGSQDKQNFKRPDRTFCDL